MSSEEIIRNIIRDIVSRSSTVIKTRRTTAVVSEKKVHTWQVTETLAAFMVRSIVLDPRCGFNVNEEMDRGAVERLIQTCVNKITLADDPMMETIKMQLYFDANFPAQANFLHKEKQSKNNAASPFLREISEAKAKNLPAYEAIYRKIISYVMVKSQLGIPTDVRVVRETTAALESVFPQSELAAFVGMSRSEKETQLNGLVQLVTGIRLFNKRLGKGGQTIEDLPTVCTNDLNDLLLLVSDLTRNAEDECKISEGIFDYFAATPQETAKHENFIPRLQQNLAFRRQILIFVDAIQDQIIKSRETLRVLDEKFERTLQDLKTTCRMKTAVPVDQVYPVFIILAHYWSSYEDELFCLAFRRGIVETLQTHASTFSLDIPNALLAASSSFIKEPPADLTEAQIVDRAAQTMTMIALVKKGIEVIYSGNSTQFYKLPVEYGGFCPVSLVDKFGMVVPGDKTLGLLKFKDKLYTFDTLASAKKFAIAPELYLETVLGYAKLNPDLVQLFQLLNYFPTIGALEAARSYTRQRALASLPMNQECGVQTDTHIVDTYIDPKYEWNEWSLRRQALMLVNLRNKQTHSTQTKLSHFKRESETQTYLPKLQMTQTSHNLSTQVPKKVNYLAGLRNDGKGNGKFRVIDLTIDL